MSTTGDEGDDMVEPGSGSVSSTERKPVKRSIWNKLYHGDTHINFIGRSRIFFTVSALLVLVSIVSLLTRGLKLGIDFEGGVVWEVPSGGASIEDARSTLTDLGINDAKVQTQDNNGTEELRIQAEPLEAAESDKVTAELAKLTDSTVDDVNFNEVGPSWGREISDKAVRALVVFLVLVTLYITLRFEWMMAIPTLVALIHDVVITAGVYSITGFEVTPATVIAILTILGFSIYDGIVVFDKVDENTRLVSSTGGLSYGGMVNLSLNQTLMRSLNTSLTALLPVGSLLIIGSWIMGAHTLQEFALALMIGLFSGAYSSIFIASPLLAVLKEREPRYRDIKRRVEARGGDMVVPAVVTPGGVVRPSSGTGAKAGADPESSVVTSSGRVIPARPRKKTKGGPRR
jgi:preprotein translocase subunit SecF